MAQAEEQGLAADLGVNSVGHWRLSTCRDQLARFGMFRNKCAYCDAIGLPRLC